MTDSMAQIWRNISTLCNTTLRLHYNALVGVHEIKISGPHYIHVTVVQNATSFKGFHIHKQMPHPPSFGMGYQSVYLVLWL